MNRFLLLVLLWSVVFSMTSCLNNVQSNFTPQIYCSYLYVNPIMEGDSVVSAKDTLNFLFNTKTNAYDTDTILVGDTVMFASAFYTVENNMVSVKLDWDSTHLNLWYPLSEDVTNILTDKTDLSVGDMFFNPGYNLFPLSIYFTPVSSGGTNLELTVVSDSEYSTASVLFYFPVKASNVVE